MNVFFYSLEDDYSDSRNVVNKPNYYRQVCFPCFFNTYKKPSDFYQQLTQGIASRIVPSDNGRIFVVFTSGGGRNHSSLAYNGSSMHLRHVASQRQHLRTHLIHRHELAYTLKMTTVIVETL